MRRLILIPRLGEPPDYTTDFEEIADRIRRRDQNIEVVVHWSDPSELRPGPPRQTLIVSIAHLDGPLPVPGRLFACRGIDKTVQAEAYRRHYIPTPPGAVFSWGMAPDPRQFGSFVVIKPLELGRTSAGGALWCPTALLPKLRPGDFAPEHPIHDEPFLVQAFINTGRYPCHWRVLMLCGEPIYSLRISLRNPRPAMAGTGIDDILGANIATNGGDRNIVLAVDDEVMAFARQAFNALPDVPLQGIDVLREVKTGRLFAIESNPGGNTWQISAAFGERIRAQIGDGRTKLTNQLGALDRAADGLIRATRTYAA